MKAYRGNKHIATCSLTLSTRWRWWQTSCPSRFTPQKEPPLLTEYKVGWAPQLVWTFWKREKPPIPSRIKPRTIQPIAITKYRLHYLRLLISVKYSKCTSCVWRSGKKKYTEIYAPVKVTTTTGTVLSKKLIKQDLKVTSWAVHN
jgi:hypothetical protein